MQEIGYPSDRRARMPNRIQGHPWKLEPGELSSFLSPRKCGNQRDGGKILPLPLFLCFPISCQCLPLSKLSLEPVLMEPGKCSQQGLASAKQGKAGEFGGRELKANCPRTSMKGVKIRSTTK